METGVGSHQEGQGQRDAHFPRNYSPVRREGGGTRTVVRGKGEGGGAARDGHQENSDKGGGIASLAETRKPFARQRACRTSHTIWESNQEPRH